MSRTLALLGLLPVLLLACGDSPADPLDTPLVDSPAPAAVPPAQTPLTLTPAEGPAVLRVLSEGGVMEGGTLVVDAYERDLVYLGVVLETESGRAIPQRAVTVSSPGNTQIITSAPGTDEDGYFEFQLLAPEQGRQAMKVAAAGVSREFVLNVVANPQLEWVRQLGGDVVPWETLMAADLVFDQLAVRARFPDELAKLDTQSVKLGGFMVPLEAAADQKHFLLSANPPSCFYHLPGGPTTVVEVFASKPIAASFEPLLLRGRLELVEESEVGVVYRLHDAEIDPRTPSVRGRS